MHRVLVLVLLGGLLLAADNHPEWHRPFPAHRVAGNLYYVGTEDLACYLITTPAGHILINTGLVDSAPLIRAGIAQLGFRLEDVKILLTMQAHYDHVAAMAEVKRLSGAKLYATAADAPIIESGGKADPTFGKSGWFAPVKVDRRLHDGEMVSLGGTGIKVVLTPGHTPGSVSYLMTVMEKGRPQTVAIANMGSVVMPLVGNRKYPRIAEDFAASFAKQRELHPDIWVAGHASQYRMAEKLKAGTFVDPEGYQAAVARYEKEFEETLDKERRAARK